MADTAAPFSETGTEELRNAVRGHRLAEIRRSRGLTQHHLAEKLGVSVVTDPAKVGRLIDQKPRHAR